jgi:excisionase family DNA binding protein
MEIEKFAVYTPLETQEILKISNSTMKRLIKSKQILANKVGGQYRILGSELLRLLTPIPKPVKVKSKK